MLGREFDARQQTWVPKGQAIGPSTLRPADGTVRRCRVACPVPRARGKLFERSAGESEEE